VTRDWACTSRLRHAGAREPCSFLVTRNKVPLLAIGPRQTRGPSAFSLRGDEDSFLNTLYLTLPSNHNFTTHLPITSISLLTSPSTARSYARASSRTYERIPSHRRYRSLIKALSPTSERSLQARKSPSQPQKLTRDASHDGRVRQRASLQARPALRRRRLGLSQEV
jgi:hypothetical protein